jgi:hypothetical protein
MKRGLCHLFTDKRFAICVAEDDDHGSVGRLPKCDRCISDDEIALVKQEVPVG